MPRFSIGTHDFRTKTDALAEVRRILNSVQLGDTVRGEDGKLIAALMYDGRHPETLEKIGSGIERIEVRAASHGTRCFWIVRSDGTEVDFSFVTAMNGQPSRKAGASAAMREEISGQVSAYRRSQPQTVQCSICGSPTERDSAFVTYLNPTFEQMAQQFADEHGGWEALPEVAIGAYGRQLADRGIAEEWQSLHRAKARLSLTHPRCNLTRSRTY
jgi:Protein of unknown function (DUF3223)